MAGFFRTCSGNCSIDSSPDTAETQRRNGAHHGPLVVQATDQVRRSRAGDLTQLTKRLRNLRHDDACQPPSRGQNHRP